MTTRKWQSEIETRVVGKVTLTVVKCSKDYYWAMSKVYREWTEEIKCGRQPTIKKAKLAAMRAIGKLND